MEKKQNEDHLLTSSSPISSLTLIPHRGFDLSGNAGRADAKRFNNRTAVTAANPTAG
jgi:hypothetical protein